eukprot:gnl/TRDRNA2_/TRDRNA2_91476_c0_seq1.p1 gnl/TRDRNA2_/TRDRNA2_91476_c0~~gnl/TRDRNA2_/TRDRNA2_91476_c0_seq1.p1  ORF type:complete len:243 (+),score=51.77 gnl/TRDRNA2_/TRDRNA2_91476_c0_seq1:75-803(+)
MGCTSSTLPEVSTRIRREVEPIFPLHARELKMPDWINSSGSGFLDVVMDSTPLELVTMQLHRCTMKPSLYLRDTSRIMKDVIPVKDHSGNVSALIAPAKSCIMDEAEDLPALIYAAKPKAGAVGKNGHPKEYDGKRFFPWAKASCKEQENGSLEYTVELLEGSDWTPLWTYKIKSSNNDVTKGFFVHSKQSSNIVATVQRSTAQHTSFKVANDVDAALVVIAFTALMACAKLYSPSFVSRSQ